MEELNLSAKTKGRASEKTGKSECKFRLIIRLRITCQVSTAYILLVSKLLCIHPCRNHVIDCW